MNPRAVMPSSIGSSTRPLPRIWKKWSMTQIESKPASSAWRTIRASVGPIASGPPGQVNELIWRPTFMLRSVLLAAPVDPASSRGDRPAGPHAAAPRAAAAPGDDDPAEPGPLRATSGQRLASGRRPGSTASRRSSSDGGRAIRGVGLRPVVVVTAWRDAELMLSRDRPGRERRSCAGGSVWTSPRRAPSPTR